MTNKPKRHTLMRSKLLGLSLKWDDAFIHNLVVVTGTVLVWAGLRGLLEKHLFDESDGKYIISITMGIILLFLLDGSLERLGGYKKVVDKTKEQIIISHKDLNHHDNNKPNYDIHQPIQK